MLPEKITEILALPIVSAIIVFLICWIAITIILKVADRLLARSKTDPALKGFAKKGITGALWLLAIIVVADKLGIHTASFVALLSVAGLALSLSVQGIMSNLFSGITILTTKPFATGDFVELDGAAGTVGAVGFFYTKISTIDNKLIYIPNGQVTGGKIVNYSREEARRVDLKFSASYDDSTESVKSALMDAVADSRVLSTPAEPFVGLLNYGESSVEYAVRVWVDGKDYWDVYFAINERVREIFNERGISMTYAHMNVHIMKD